VKREGSEEGPFEPESRGRVTGSGDIRHTQSRFGSSTERGQVSRRIAVNCDRDHTLGFSFPSRVSRTQLG